MKNLKKALSLLLSLTLVLGSFGVLSVYADATACWDATTGNLTVYGSGEVTEADVYNAVGNDLLRIRKVVIGEGVISLPADATGTVTVNVDGNDYTVPVSGGEAVCAVKALEPGTFTVTVSYSGDDKYNSASQETSVAVSKCKCDINVETDPEEPTPTESTPTEPTPTEAEPAHEHDYKGEVTKEPTCTEDGIMTYTCECGESYTQAIPKTGHKPGAWTVVTPATTEAAGKEVKKCEVCGETIAEREIAKLEPDTADADIVGVNLEKTNAFGIANAFGVDPEKLPAGSTITWYVNGEKAGEGNGFRVENPTEDYTIKAVVTNRDGKVIGETEEVNVKVNNSFFARLYYWLCRIIQKVIDFFKNISN